MDDTQGAGRVRVMGKFEPRRYFVSNPGYPPMTFSPVLSLADELAKSPALREVGFREWFEVMWQQSDYTDAPWDVPTERDYWEHWR